MSTQGRMISGGHLPPWAALLDPNLKGATISVQSLCWRVFMETGREAEWSHWVKSLGIFIVRSSQTEFHSLWSELLWHSFGVDGWACFHCGEHMSLRAPQSCGFTDGYEADYISVQCVGARVT